MLSSPLTVRGLRLRNRVVRTAHGTSFGRGSINDRLIAYHVARGRGGVALSILEVASVHPSSPAGIRAYDGAAVDGYGRIARAVHAEGMALFQQLWHGGVHAHPRDGTPS